MANGRFLSSSIAYDSRLNSLSLEAEYIYLKAIPHLDRDGLIQGDPALLFATVCPRRVDMISRIEDVINEWIALELVTRYDGWQEGAVLFFHGFKRNQTGLRYEREKPSQFAAPPGYIRTEQGLRMVQEDVETEAPSADPDDVRHYSGSAPAPVGSNTREKCEVGSVKCELGSVNWEGVGGGGVKSLSPTHQPVVQENGTPDTDTDADQGQDYTMGKAPYGQHLRSTWERYADELIRSHYTEWRGHKPYIQRLEDTELIHLVEWCVSLADDTAGQIKNYPAVIKSNVRQRASPLNLTRIRHREMSNWLTKLSREGT